MNDSLKTGAVILQIAIVFDKLRRQGRSDLEAIAELKAGYNFDVRIVQALETLPPDVPETKTRVVEISSLEPGMVLDEEIRSTIGLLLAGKGQEVTYPLVVRLKNFHRRRLINDNVVVLVVGDAVPAQRQAAGAH